MKRRAEHFIEQWYRKQRRKPLVIRGARQVGKSTLVRRVAKTLDVPLWEVNLERYASLNSIFATNNVSRIIIEAGIVTGLQGIGNIPGILFFDEIQATPQALTALRYFYEDRPDIAVIAAGSLLEFALKDFKSSMPVGRIEYFHLGPALFSECLADDQSAQPLNDFFKAWNFSEPFSEAAHKSLLDRLRDFVLVGGMPEAAEAFLRRHDLQEVHAIHRSILETYHDDFGKYSTGAELEKLRRVFEFLPSTIGEKFKFVRVNPHWRSIDIRHAVDQIALAGIISIVHHTDASGIPLGAHASDAVWKPLFLDVGLVGTALGLPLLTQEAFRSTRFVNEGPLAEQFAGQHLLYKSSVGERPKLHYWLREGKTTNAEVDFVVELGEKILPIEIKSGASGTMRSLHQFAAIKNTSVALRFDLNPPSVQSISLEIQTAKGRQPVSYTLVSLPLYLVERGVEIVSEVKERPIKNLS
jgi:predicted AAA+ superfamily ATPase